MNILDKAKFVVVEGKLEDLHKLLKECIAIRDLESLLAIKMLYEEMYDGFTYNYEFKAPAAFCLLAWGNRGIDAIVEGAKRINTSKNVLITLQVLASLASMNKVDASLFYIYDKEIIKEVNYTIGCDKEISNYASIKLTEYILSFDSDDEVASAIGTCMQRSSFYKDDKVAKQLFSSLATRWMALGRAILEEYNSLISNNPNDETVFQNFFEKHPQFLDPMALQVWPKPNFHGFKEPDFVIRRTDNTYIIVEIEKPAKMIVTSANQVSADVTQAVTQAMQYRTFLLERFREASTYFPEFQDPETLVIVGLEGVLTEQQKKALIMDNQHRSKIRIVGFDWIGLRAKNITNNVIQNKVGVGIIRMV